MKPLTVVQILVGTLLLTQTMLSALAQDPDVCVGPDEFDFEQRLSRLESVLTSEGCVDSGSYRSDCVQEPSLYAGYKFLFIKPQMKESFEATVTNVGTGELTLVPLDYNFNVTPNIWIGYRTPPKNQPDQSTGELSQDFPIEWIVYFDTVSTGEIKIYRRPGIKKISHDLQWQRIGQGWEALETVLAGLGNPDAYFEPIQTQKIAKSAAKTDPREIRY